MSKKPTRIFVSSPREQFEEIDLVFQKREKLLANMRTSVILQVNFTAAFILLTLFYTQHSALGLLFVSLVRGCVFALIGTSLGLNSNVTKANKKLFDLTLGAAVSIHKENLDLNDFDMPAPVRHICSKMLQDIQSGHIKVELITEEGGGVKENDREA